MQTLILTLHIIVCVLLVILVLLQSGKEGMGVIFGGGSSSVFGGRGAGGILVKLTAFMAVLFVITSLSYNYVTTDSSSDDSVILDVKFEEDVVPNKSDADVAPVLNKSDVKADDAVKADEMKASDTNAKETANEVVPPKTDTKDAKGDAAK